jgi:hypothetical protein
MNSEQPGVMVTLADEQLRALRAMARASKGCTKSVLVA